MAKLIRGWTTKIFGWTSTLPNHNPIDGKSDQKKIQQAIKWVAAEHDYVAKVSQDLDQLTADLERASKILSRRDRTNQNKMYNDVKKALRDYRYVGKCERRFNQREKEVESILEELKHNVEGAGTLHELEILSLHIQTAARSLLKYCSLREGIIRDQLLELKAMIERDRTTPGILSVPLFITKLRIIQNEINETQTWIASLSTDFDRAMELDKGIQFRATRTSRDSLRAQSRLRA